MLSTIRTYARAAIGVAVAALGFMAWVWRTQAKNAREKARAATQRAKGEKAAREHVQSTVEDTHEVEQESSRLGPDARRDRLRDEWSAANRD